MVAAARRQRHGAAAISSETNRNPSSGRSTVTLYLDLDDLADPDEADGLHHDGADDHHLAHLFLEQQLHVLGVDERQRHRQRGRQRQQHVAGEAAVRRVDAHLPQDLEALADRRGEVVENLGQVAAGFALDQTAVTKNLTSIMRHALGQLVQRVLERQTEVLLLEGLLELEADGSGSSSATMPIAGLERVAGANRARQQVERLRELLFELRFMPLCAIEQTNGQIGIEAAAAGGQRRSAAANSVTPRKPSNAASPADQVIERRTSSRPDCSISAPARTGVVPRAAVEPAPVDRLLTGRCPRRLLLEPPTDTSRGAAPAGDRRAMPRAS